MFHLPPSHLEVEWQPSPQLLDRMLITAAMTETVHEFKEKNFKSACTCLCLKNLNNVRLRKTLHKLFSVIKQVHI